MISPCLSCLKEPKHGQILLSSLPNFVQADYQYLYDLNPPLLPALPKVTQLNKSV